MKTWTPLNPRHLRLPLEFVHSTFLACKDTTKRAYWKRVLHAQLLGRLTMTYREYTDRDFRFQRDMIRQKFCRLAQDVPGFRHFLWLAHERVLEKINAAESDWFRARNVV